MMCVWPLRLSFTCNMEETTFDEVFRWICKFHGKLDQLDPQVRAEWWRRWRNEYDDVFAEASALATSKLAPGRFPSIEQMQHFVAEAREILWQRVKDREPKKPFTKYEPRDHRNVERGRQWMAGIIAISEGKQSADDLIVEMNGPRITPRDQE
jgi:hypothetical protein